MGELSRYDFTIDGIEHKQHEAALADAKAVGCPCLRDDDNPYRFLCGGHYPEYKEKD